MWRIGRRAAEAASAVILLTGLAVSGAVHGAEAKAKRPPVSRPVQPEEERDAASAALPESVKAERVLARKPADRAARLRAAQAHLTEGADSATRVEAAKEHVLAVLAENSTDAEALLIAAQASLLQGNAVDAARYYRSATVSNPTNATAFLGLGDALTRLGDEAGATLAFAQFRNLMGMPPLQQESTRDSRR